MKCHEQMRVVSQPILERDRGGGNSIRGDKAGGANSTVRSSIDDGGDKPKWRDSPRKNKTLAIPLNIGVQAKSIKLT